MSADQAALHRRAVEEFDARVRAVGDDQWELPTPCSDWNVRQLVNHLVYENRWTVPLMEGSTIAAVGDRYEGDLLGDDPKAAWAESSADAVRSVQADGALERVVDLSSGPTPAGEYVSQLFADHLVHAWDLARATGQDERLAPDLVAACAAWFAEREDLYRAGGVIGPAVTADGDDPQADLVGRFGRNPSPDDTLATIVRFNEAFDAAFSNATLHWVLDKERAARAIWFALKPGGRFAGEMGGECNLARLREALDEELVARGFGPPSYAANWYPSVDAFVALYESVGFRDIDARLIERPTPLEHGVEGWVLAFRKGWLDRAEVPEDQRPAIAAAVARRHGSSTADYIRLRFTMDKP